MRLEPNINVHINDEHGVVHKTAITEIKNLNSFSVLERATAYEIQRQLHEWESTGSLGKKSTYGWDESTGQTFHQRDKEEAHDYRYFPDPDLLPLEIEQGWVDHIKASLPELPDEKKTRFVTAYGMTEYDAGVLTAETDLANYYEETAKGVDGKQAANWVINEVLGRANKQGVTPEELVKPEASNAILAMLKGDVISNKVAKDVLDIHLETGEAPEQIVEQRGLKQVTDTGAIEAAVDALMAANPANPANRPAKRNWISRLLWLLAIWTASVAAVGLAAALMKLLMRTVGLS
jgi:aspartyl-tRNA(Asn)/glutamyl-tRNA(Gln) amidotransferase subunit B